MIERLCVIGVGLIGGSVARAARREGLCREIVGVDASADNLAKAFELGVIDAGYTDVARGTVDADLIVIATPVGAFAPVFDALRQVWNERAIVTDTGSTKQSVVDAMMASMGRLPLNFVPGHPIAGAEKSGVEAATDDLYRGKRVILTPLPQTDVQAVAKVERFWQAVGARVSCMDPKHHDEVLAATSHLPHVLAFALVHMLGRKDEQQEIFQYAAGGFRDFSRIASSDPRMWLDICQANRASIEGLIGQYVEELQQLASMLSRGAGDELFTLFSEARDARQRFLDQLDR